MPLIDPETTSGDTSQPASRETLSTTALRSLRTFFDQHGHFPSDAHWAALRDITDTWRPWPRLARTRWSISPQSTQA